MKNNLKKDEILKFKNELNNIKSNIFLYINHVSCELSTEDISNLSMELDADLWGSAVSFNVV